jgi:hypothetical protein
MRAEDVRKNARDLPDATSKRSCDTLARRANQVMLQSLLRRNVNPAVMASVSEAIPYPLAFLDCFVA